MTIEQSKGNPCSSKQAWRTLCAARAEAVGSDANWIDPCRMAMSRALFNHYCCHENCRNRLTLSRHQNRGLVQKWRRMSVMGKKVKDSGRSTSMIVGSSLVPMLENITPTASRWPWSLTCLLPVRDRVIFAKDSDEDRGSDSAVSEGWMWQYPDRKTYQQICFLIRFIL